MLKVYGADLSSPANKVRFVANYLGLEFEYIPVKIREGEHRKAEFLAMNPVGKIPVIDDEGFFLFESNAICRYLCDKQESDLYPRDIKERAVIDQWIDFAAIHVNGAMGRILFNRVFYKLAKIEQDERSLEDGIKFLGRFLPVLNAQLGNNPFIAGDKISLADIVLLSAIDPVEVGEVDISPYENLVAWREKLMKEAFYQKTHERYGEILKEFLAKAEPNDSPAEETTEENKDA